jgi:hypothetical protein
VRAVAIAWMLAAACSYSDPNYNGTHFHCDDQHACPAGQLCISNVCGGGSGSGSGSGMGDGIKCGGAGVCAAGSACCSDPINGDRCIAASDSCPGESALCDGVEDCSTGQRCCSIGSPHCAADSCNDAACTEPSDCPAVFTQCCFDFGAPWGRCC